MVKSRVEFLEARFGAVKPLFNVVSHECGSAATADSFFTFFHTKRIKWLFSALFPSSSPMPSPRT